MCQLKVIRWKFVGGYNKNCKIANTVSFVIFMIIEDLKINRWYISRNKNLYNFNTNSVFNSNLVSSKTCDTFFENSIFHLFTPGLKFKLPIKSNIKRPHEKLLTNSSLLLFTSTHYHYHHKSTHKKACNYITALNFFSFIRCCCLFLPLWNYSLSDRLMSALLYRDNIIHHGMDEFFLW